MNFDKCMNIKKDIKKKIQESLLITNEKNYKSDYQNNLGKSKQVE